MVNTRSAIFELIKSLFTASGLRLCITLLIAYGIILVVYRLWFHPLSKYPGPLIYRIGRIGWAYHMLRGDWIYAVSKMHEVYGPVVRVATDELSFVDPEAWRDIYGNRPGFGDLPKATRLFRPSSKIPPSLVVTADRAEHRRLRALIHPSFTERSLRLQEPLITKYVSILMQRLQALSDESQVVDMAKWFNFTTFDMMGDLSFGESFQCLETSEFHPWCANLYGMARQLAVLLAVSNLGFRWLVTLIFITGQLKKRGKNTDITTMMLERRLQKKRNDLLTGLLENGGKESPLSMTVLQPNASMLMLGGSETTSTLLSGFLFLLLSNQQAYQDVVREIRSRYGSVDEINMASTSDLPQLMASINEALRRYSPTAGSQPRFVPPGSGGVTIGRYFVPENTVVSVYPYCAAMCSLNFKDPTKYDPRRFLGDVKYASDKLEASQPFGLGPRSCLGKSLAYAQARLILSRLLYCFDMELAEPNLDWLNQRHQILWAKNPLNVHIRKAT